MTTQNQNTETPGAGGPVDPAAVPETDPIAVIEALDEQGIEPTEAQTEAAIKELIEEVIDNDGNDEDDDEIDDEEAL